ncbi:MAG: GNAT family N-acetyltransferase [Candidatus Marsarchaeota archaeon]
MRYEEIREKNEDFEDAVAIYRESFKDKSVAVSPEIFERSLGSTKVPALALLRRGKEPISMARFAVFPEGAVIWYLAVKPSERGKGYGTTMVRKVLETLTRISKDVGAEFVFAEYEDALAGFWERNGFRKLPVNYYQPPISDGWVRMNLGAKPLTARCELSGEALLRFIKKIYSDVYGVNYLRDQHFTALEEECRGLLVWLCRGFPIKPIMKRPPLAAMA